MTDLRNKRKRFFANSLHREMFILVFLAMAVPLLVTAVGMFYFIFYIMADEVAMPEAIAATVIPAAERVLSALIAVLPVVMLVILWVAHRMTHRIVGPFDRIVRELEQTVKGERQGPIRIRPGDRFVPLVDLINRLM